MRGQVGIDLDFRSKQGDVAGCGHLQRTVDQNRTGAGDFDRAQLRRVQGIGVQIERGHPISRQCGGQVQTCGDSRRPLPEHDVFHGAGIRPQGVLQRGAVLDVIRHVTTDHELGTAGHGFLRLQITVQAFLRGLGLAFALIGVTHNLALQNRTGGTDDQASGIAPYGVGTF